MIFLIMSLEPHNMFPGNEKWNSESNILPLAGVTADASREADKHTDMPLSFQGRWVSQEVLSVPLRTWEDSFEYRNMTLKYLKSITTFVAAEEKPIMTNGN